MSARSWSTLRLSWVDRVPLPPPPPLSSPPPQPVAATGTTRTAAAIRAVSFRVTGAYCNHGAAQTRHAPSPLSILFVYSRDSTFIRIDREILARRWEVREWPQARALVNLPRLLVAVWRSDLVFGWFASWHTFWPVTLAWLLRRPSVVVIGGFDTASLPEIDYGLQQRRVMRRVSRWVMRRATRLVTNSHYSAREIEANVGIPGSAVQ